MLYLYATHLNAPKDRHTQRKNEHAAAYRLLHDLAEILHLPDAPIVTTHQGRPYFVGMPSVDFSLSHTKELCVCALSYREGEIAPRVGVDAEEAVLYDEEKIAALCARFFGEHEKRYVEESKDHATAFTEVFTRKEAFAKYTGDGLGKHTRGTDTLHPHFEKNENVRFFTYREGNVAVCLCTSHKEAISPPLILI